MAPEGVYPRGNSLWVRYTTAEWDPDKKKWKRAWAPTGLRVGEEAKAAAALAVIKLKMKAQRDLLRRTPEDGAPVLVSPKGVTVAIYWNHRLQRRLLDPKTASAAKANVWHGRDYLLPAVGHILLTEFRPRHARALAAELAAKKREDGSPALAPRTVHTVWWALHGMFRAAVIDELISSNPCILEPGDLPTKKDRDPKWRRTAVFSRDEVEALISDARIPNQRRVLYALLFGAGLRPGEASALRWRDYDPTWEPLGLLDVQRAYDTDGRAEGDTKTEKQRLIPTHPALAKVLGQWRLSGWQAHLGRAPGPEDLIVPNQQGTYQSGNGMRNRAVKDLQTLGWRKRRFYDTRRSFITRCQADLIPKDIYRWWTHGPPPGAGDAVDLYASVDWPAHCREMLKLKLEVREGRLLKMAASGASNRDNRWDSLDELLEIPSVIDIGARGFEPPTTLSLLPARTNKSAEPLADASRQKPTPPPDSGTTVPLSHPITAVVAELHAAAVAFEASHDAKELRQRLEAVLAVLSGGGR